MAFPFSPAEEAELEDVVEPVHSKNKGPIPLRIRKPFPVNQSWDLLHRFYSGLFGFEDYVERGYLTKDLAWQSITYKSYNHGVDPYNEKLAHLGSPLQDRIDSRKTCNSNDNSNSHPRSPRRTPFKRSKCQRSISLSHGQCPGLPSRR